MIYVKTNSDSKDLLRDKLANVVGITSAINIVDDWFDNYTEILFNDDNNSLLFYKKRSTGYCESNQEALEKFR